MPFKRQDLFNNLNAAMIEAGRDIKSAQDVVDMTEAALGSALASFTFFFKNRSFEDRIIAVNLMMDCIENIAKVAVDHLMTHDAPGAQNGKETTH